MTTDSGGSGSGRGGSGGRSRGRSSSFIAGRRPSTRQAAPEEPEKPAARSSAAADAGSAAARDDARPTRRRRRPAAKPAAEATATKATEARKAAPEPTPAPEEPAPAAPTAVVSTPVRRAPERATRTADNGAHDNSDLRALLDEQRAMLLELKQGFSALERRITEAGPRPRLGIFVDVPNLLYGQDADEKPINAGKLLTMISRNREVVRATAYSPVSDDPSEPIEQQKFVAPFVPYEYRIVTKPLKRFADGSIKGNFDVEMAIDMITMADRLDVIAIVSGDADFARAVETVQARGVRVEVVSFARSTSLEMRALADHFLELGAIVEQLR